MAKHCSKHQLENETVRWLCMPIYEGVVTRPWGLDPTLNPDPMHLQQEGSQPHRQECEADVVQRLRHGPVHPVG